VPDWLPDPIEYRFPRWVRDGGDGMAMTGLDRIPYGIPHVRAAYTPVDTEMPIGWWRSVGASQNAFFVESFLDELAHAAKRDPYRYRRELLGGRERELRVLDRAAALSDWGKTLSAGRGRGMALYAFAESVVCEVVELSLPGAGELRVHRVTCVVDCGRAVNPDTVRAQMEGGILFALSAALREKITVREGAVEQSNFHDYPLLRLADAPRIDVHIIDSDAPPSGVGEPGTPPLAPALANAVFAASGRRIRSLPLRDGPGARPEPPA
jgi:isoquinoline 1-oxidoreductase beta subunit